MHSTAIGFHDEKHLISSFIHDVFSRTPGMKIYFNSRNETSLFDALRNATPDVLIINLTRKINFNTALIRTIKDGFPSLKIVGFVYGMELSQQEVFRIINAGVASILTDAHSPEEVFSAIDSVMKKGFHINDVVHEAMFAYCKRSNILRKSFGPKEKFCEREIKIMEGKRAGKTSREIAGELCVSKKTVDGILQDMYGRFECKNFYELLGKYNDLPSG